MPVVKVSAPKLADVGGRDPALYLTLRELVDQVNAALSPRVTGTATLVAGAVIVQNGNVTKASLIPVWYVTPGANTGILSAPLGSRISGKSFVIHSSNALDASVVAFEIINP